MIDFYGMGSPNVLKVAIMLEEAGLEYRSHHVRIGHGDNFSPEFLALNPIGKVPVIVDHNGAGPEMPIFESGAILIYLAETYMPELFPASGPLRWSVLKWLMFQMSLVGPMLGQVNHFQSIPSQEKGYAADRFRDQGARVFQNIEDRLKESTFIAGNSLTIADIAIYPWMGYILRHGLDEADYPHLIAWRDKFDAKGSVKRGSYAFQEISMGPKDDPMPTDEQLDGLYARRKSGGPKADLMGYYKRGPMFTAVSDKDAKD